MEVASSLEYLWKKWLQAFILGCFFFVCVCVCVCVRGHKFSAQVGKYLGLCLLDHMMMLYIAL